MNGKTLHLQSYMRWCAVRAKGVMEFLNNNCDYNNYNITFLRRGASGSHVHMLIGTTKMRSEERGQENQLVQKVGRSFRLLGVRRA